MSFKYETTFLFEPNTNHIDNDLKKGKTTLIKALFVLNQLAKRRIDQIEDILIPYFNNKESIHIESEMLINGVSYIYKVSIKDKLIENESLSFFKNGSETLCINREGDSNIQASEDYYLNFRMHNTLSILNLSDCYTMPKQIEELNIVQDFFESFYFDNPFELSRNKFDKFDLHNFSEILNNCNDSQELLLEWLKKNDNEIDSLFINESFNYEGQKKYSLFIKQKDTDTEYLVPYYLFSSSNKRIINMMYFFKLREQNKNNTPHYFADDFKALNLDFMINDLVKDSYFYYF